MILRSDPWDMALNLHKHETNDLRIHTTGMAWNLSLKTNTTRQSLQLTASALDDSPLSPKSEEAEDLSIPTAANTAIRCDSESEDCTHPQTSPHFTDWSQSDEFDCQETPEDLSSTTRPDCQENHCVDSSIVEDISPKRRKKRKQSNPVRITNFQGMCSTKGINGKSQNQSCLSANPLEALNLTLNQHGIDLHSYENSSCSPCNTSRFPSAVCSHCKSAVPLTDFAKHFLENHAASFTLPLFGPAAEDDPLPSSNSNFPAFLTPVTSPSPLVHSITPGDGSNSEAYCYLCDKEFCNKHVLKKHKIKKNWTRSNPPTDSYSALNLSSPHALPASSIAECTSSSILTPLNSKAAVSALPTGLLGLLKAEVDGDGTGECTGEVEQMQRRSSSLPMRSYCEICQKELCNKYFMKKHMLKMHGIDLGSQSQLGGVTCDICFKEVCSKYFLKAHKQRAHGIYEIQVEPLALTTEKLTTKE